MSLTRRISGLYNIRKHTITITVLNREAVEEVAVMGRCNDVVARTRQILSRHFAVSLPAELIRVESAPRVFWVKLFLALVITLTVTACGGGGSSGTGSSSNTTSPPPIATPSPPPTPTSIILSGTVTAPGGVVVFAPRRNLFLVFAEALFPAANASLVGTTVVPDGTQVDLVKIDDTGTIVTVVASATTVGGNYSFDLTKLGVGYTSDLVAQVTSASSGAKMRAFVGSGGIVDLNPVSETAVRVVMDQIAASSGTTLSNFTVQELSDITAAVNLLVMTQSLTSGFDIETTVAALKSAVVADANIMGFIVAASAAGQTSQGSGDIGDYFPFASGMTWQYQGTVQNGGQTTNYTDTVQITGQKVVNGVTTTVFHETNPNPANGDPASDDYLVKDDQGVTDYGNTDTTDFVTPQVAPYREYAFPLGLNTSFQPINKAGVNWAQDIDGDGKPETATITATQTVSTFENVTVTAGAFHNTAKIVTNLVIFVVLSSDGTTVTDTNTISEWYAPGIGLVKSTSVEQTTYQNVTDTTTTTEELTNFIPPFTSTTVGGSHSCGITVAGAAYCWGNNAFGQLGNGVLTNSSVPVRVSDTHLFSSLSAGASFTCGITTNGNAYCWGNNSEGQLGDGTTINSNVPVAVLGGITFATLSASAGESTVCGVTSTGRAYCWGSNATGQLGNGSFSPNSATPVAVSGGYTFSSVSVGSYHTCGVISAGAAYCWGQNSSLQLGNGTTTGSATPVMVSGGLTFESLSAGAYHTCGITVSGAAYCWGVNVQGQFGDGTTTEGATPVPAAGGLLFESLAAGSDYTCGVTTAGAGYCWGFGGFGQLGNGSTAFPVTQPAMISGQLQFRSISVGYDTSCGVTIDNIAYCWGDNSSGQLGNGGTLQSTIPALVL